MFYLPNWNECMLLASDIGVDIAEQLMLIVIGVPLTLASVFFMLWIIKKLAP